MDFRQTGFYGPAVHLAKPHGDMLKVKDFMNNTMKRQKPPRKG
jgi:hypothetical protein